jgi:hypothetical protein
MRRTGGWLEQHLVSIARLCGHQLHEELGLRLFCCYWVVDRSVRVDDLVGLGKKAGGGLIRRITS